MGGKKRAVVLFNLGGPDRLDSVEPFLANLFSDPAIIGLPSPMRGLLARFIARRRGPKARAIYAELGGGSPLLPLTREQAEALEAELGARGMAARVFVAMRYWHPMSAETAAEVAAYGADEVVLLPLYPQYSMTTTGSSLKAWHVAAKTAGLDAPTRAVCCYPRQPGLIAAVAALVRAEATSARERGETMRILFSAHGLPKRVIARGDPYQWQVEATVEAVVADLGDLAADHAICYQSRVGPLKWIGPATEAELARAAADAVARVIVVPIAFVSEHSETLVELDIEYRKLAAELGIEGYTRVPAVGTTPAFIAGLADLVGAAAERPPGLFGPDGARVCPAAFGQCPCATAAAPG